MSLFKDLCRKTQKEMKQYLAKKYDCAVLDGFLYRKGTIPIMLVAHMDTVHKEPPIIIKTQKGKISSPQGIGGDDRCGVYIILEILKELDCHVLFTEDEECGGIGARKFAKSDLAKELNGTINYCIEIDRRGKTDAVFYDCANDDFIDFVLEDEYWGLKTGSYTDICEIAPALDCSAVNFSSGYYKPHTLEEYVVAKEMDEIVEHIKALIIRGNKIGRFEWKTEHKRNLYYGLGFCNYGNIAFNIIYSDKPTCKIKTEIVEGFTFEEAIGKFLMYHGNLTFFNIEEIWDEDFEEQFM